MDAVLKKFEYKYLPYEKDLLEREIRALFPNCSVVADANSITLHGVVDSDLSNLKRLTYIASFIVSGEEYCTDQYTFEHNANTNGRRQNTRYATHGLHEYKGKYNPQIVRTIINYFGLKSGDKVLDPFCGSGTTQVECALSGINSIGTDINPLAVEISNLKTAALSLNCDVAKQHLSELYELLCSAPVVTTINDNPARREYLLHWIPEKTLFELETVRDYSLRISPTVGLLFILSASNLIREYSFQEPLDLRIRRRTSPMPEISFQDAWKDQVSQRIKCIELFQSTLHGNLASGHALNADIRTIRELPDRFDAAITSPPYATALPYIDTQRISLVWLGLCDPKDIMTLETSLIGSREFYHIDKEQLRSEMLQNAERLPSEVFNLILELYNSLSPDDGFRKRAVPLLLYRYFSDMKQMFASVRNLLKPYAKYALVVGNNKTTIGGRTTMIDTPRLLSIIAADYGWGVDELIPLQTYQRYGLNMKNAIHHETLIILKKDAD